MKMTMNLLLLKDAAAEFMVKKRHQHDDQKEIMMVDERNDADVMKEMEVSSAREDINQDDIERKKTEIAKARLEQVNAEADAARSEYDVIVAQEEVKRAIEEFKEVCGQVDGSFPYTGTGQGQYEESIVCTHKNGSSQETKWFQKKSQIIRTIPEEDETKESV